MTKKIHAALLSLVSAVPAAAEPVSFSREVAPILQRSCVGCHKEGKAKGKYRLDTYAQLAEELVGGDLESEFFYRITTGDKEERMPAEADALAAAEIEVIRKWIEEGAKYDGGDPEAALSSIAPMENHPAPPGSYPRPLGVTAMAVSREGTELYTGGYHEILVWNPGDGSLLRRIANNGQRTYGLALSPDGSLLAAATGAPGQAGEVRVFDRATGRVLATPFRGDDVVLAVAFDPSGKHLAFGGVDGKLRIHETGGWGEALVVAAHSDWLTALSWHHDGMKLATASRDKTAKVYDVRGKRISTFSGHSEAVRAVAFPPDGEHVLSTGDHGHLYLWRINDGRKAADRANFEGPSSRLVRSGSGIYASAPGGRMVQFKLADQQRVREFRVKSVEGAEAPSVSSCAISGSWLAVATLDGRVEIFETESGERRNGFVAKP